MSQAVNAIADFVPWRPAGVAQWPRWQGKGQRIKIAGRHLTPARGRLAQILAGWSTLALLTYPLVHCWGFRNIPQPLSDFVTGLLQGAKYTVTSERLEWVCFCLWLAAWLLFRVWQEIFCFLFGLALTTRTSVIFTAETLKLHRFGRWPRHLIRHKGIDISFSLREHPRLPWITAKMQGQRRGAELTVFYQQTRYLFLHYGDDLIPVAGFVSLARAEQFSTALRAALNFPLKHTRSSATRAADVTENTADV